MLDEISCTIPSRMPSEKLNERTQALYQRFGISERHPPEPPGLSERKLLYQRFGISGGHPSEPPGPSERKLYIRDLTYQGDTSLNPPVWANASFKTGSLHHSYLWRLVTALNIYFILVVVYFGLLHCPSAILFFVDLWSKSVRRWKEGLALIILCQFAGLYIEHRDCRLSSWNCTVFINYQAAEACRDLQNVSSSKADKRKTANMMTTCLTYL